MSEEDPIQSTQLAAPAPAFDRTSRSVVICRAREARRAPFLHLRRLRPLSWVELARVPIERNGRWNVIACIGWIRTVMDADGIFGLGTTKWHWTWCPAAAPIQSIVS